MSETYKNTPNSMALTDSNQHLMSEDGHRIVAAFKYPKYFPLSDQSLLKSPECDVNWNASPIM